jgi:HEPN domain-containing protein
MPKTSHEWLRQADYDMETAEYMFSGGRFFYAVFMCHLSIEKALKGLYQQKLSEAPPRTHNLLYLLTQIEAKPPENIARFLVRLGEASVATRYPEELARLTQEYTEPVVRDVISKSREALKWIKKEFST